MVNIIVNMFPSKVREDNDALVCYFVERNLVVRENLQVVLNYNVVNR